MCDEVEVGSTRYVQGNLDHDPGLRTHTGEDGLKWPAAWSRDTLSEQRRRFLREQNEVAAVAEGMGATKVLTDLGPFPADPVHCQVCTVASIFPLFKPSSSSFPLLTTRRSPTHSLLARSLLRAPPSGSRRPLLALPAYSCLSPPWYQFHSYFASCPC